MDNQVRDNLKDEEINRILFELDKILSEIPNDDNPISIALELTQEENVNKLQLKIIWILSQLDLNCWADPVVIAYASLYGGVILFAQEKLPEKEAEQIRNFVRDLLYAYDFRCTLYDYYIEEITPILIEG